MRPIDLLSRSRDVNMQMAIMLMEMAQLQASTTRHVTDLEAKIKSLEDQLSQQKEQEQ